MRQHRFIHTETYWFVVHILCGIGGLLMGTLLGLSTYGFVADLRGFASCADSSCPPYDGPALFAGFVVGPGVAMAGALLVRNRLLPVDMGIWRWITYVVGTIVGSPIVSIALVMVGSFVYPASSNPPRVLTEFGLFVALGMLGALAGVVVAVVDRLVESKVL